MNFLIENWQIILAVLGLGAGGGSIFTLKTGVKSAKADLVKQVREIYDTIIEDLREEMAAYKADNKEIRAELKLTREELHNAHGRVCFHTFCKQRAKTQEQAQKNNRTRKNQKTTTNDVQNNATN